MMLLRLFPLWALLLSSFALWQPQLFTGLKPAIAPLLGIIMFGMGVTLNWRNFIEVCKRPFLIFLGVTLQFGIMPFAAWLIAIGLQLSPDWFIGMLLVGACSGGTASNVICYLARGDVALSITLTTASTLLGIFFTPWLTWVYAGHVVDVQALEMLSTIFQIIFLPVALGVLINAFFARYLHSFIKIFPGISVIAIVFIIAIIMALNKANLVNFGAALGLAVILHNATGLTAGYCISRLLGQESRIARTIAIEVGMQNSGLAVALAIKHFSGSAALPGALFSIWHNISGSLLASWWARQDRPSSSVKP